MANIVGAAIKGYEIFNDKWSDPRTRNWFLISTPFPVIFIIISYVYFTEVIGPILMKKRKPMNLRYIILVYNAAQVVANLNLIIETARECLWKYNWQCEPVDFSNTEHAVKVASLTHAYFLLKITDLLDTIFFILRKKNNQVTFLHVYHHAGMVGVSWIASKFQPGGQAVFVGIVNCFVHSVMYSYYFFTSWNTDYNKSLWWKKHLTQLQLLQFFLIFIQQLQPLIMTDCTYPKWISVVMTIQYIFMTLMFGDFYIKAYVKKKNI